MRSWFVVVVVLPLARASALGQHAQPKLDAFRAIGTDFPALIAKHRDEYLAAGTDRLAACVAADGW